MLLTYCIKLTCIQDTNFEFCHLALITNNLEIVTMQKFKIS